MRAMNGWAWYWMAWIVIGFGVPEAIALISRNHQTLSETVWRWFKVQEGAPFWQWSALHVLLLVFLIWLLGHFAFHIWE